MQTSAPATDEAQADPVVASLSPEGQRNHLACRRALRGISARPALQIAATRRVSPRLEVVAAVMGRAALDAAWEAWAADTPMTWLPLDHFGQQRSSTRDAYDDAARRAGRAVL